MDVLIRKLTDADVDAARVVQTSVDHLSAGRQWAARVVVAAGLSSQPAGPVFRRGMAPPPAYLPSGPYL